MGCMELRNADQQMNASPLCIFWSSARDPNHAAHVCSAHKHTAVCKLPGYAPSELSVCVFVPCAATAWLGFNEP